MTQRLLIFALTLFLGFTNCKHDPVDGSSPIDNELLHTLNATSPTGNHDYYVLPESTNYSAIPQDPKNPLTWQKIELGKMLFFETGLALEPRHSSAKGTYSCGTCHVPSVGFLPCLPQGIADGGIGFGKTGEGREPSPRYLPEEMDIQGARPLSVINVAYVSNTFWNGQFGSGGVNAGTEDLWDALPETEINHKGYMGPESQNIEGLTVHRMVVNKDVTDSLGYTLYFDRSFPDFPEEERYSKETASLAISAYLRSLLPNKAPFQRYLKGDYEAMTDSEKRGAMLFFGKARCFYCHSSPALQSNEFHALGVKGMYQHPDGMATSKSDRRNLGRGGFTQKLEDYYKFQVPQLYNLKLAAHYFHGASKNTLAEVVEYFDKAIPENPDVPLSNISPRFTPIYLNDEEKADLTKFLEDALFDPDMERYAPPFILSGNCFPNNDPMSKVHLGCE